MSSYTDVSIVMATYNGAAYVKEQLDSFSQQTLLPRELICSDDGSTDETLSIVRRFAETAPFPVKVVVNGKQLGYSDNFFSGATHAKHRLISFSDQDDIWFPTKLERSVAAFQQPDVFIYSHAAKLVDEHLAPLGGLEPDWPNDKTYLPNELDPFSKASGFAMMVDAKIFELVDWRNRPIGFNWKEGVMIPHDRWLMLFGSILGKVVTTKDCLALYRRHSNNTSRLRNNTSVRERLKMVIQWRSTLLDNDTKLWLLGKLKRDACGLAELADFLEKLMPSLEEKYKRRMHDAAVLYRRNAQRYALRAGVYESKSAMPARAFRLMRLAGSGAYRSGRRFCFGRREFLKDLSSLVPSIEPEPSTTHSS